MAKVLIAEDDLICRRIIVKVVESMGHTAIQSSDGLTCWSVLESNCDIGLLISDIMMPRLSGYELLDLCRQNDKFQSLPIIMVSGVVQLKEIDDLLKRGANRFLPKPLAIDDLRTYIELLIKEPTEKAEMP